MRGDQAQSLHTSFNNRFLDRGLPHQTFINGRLHLLRIHSQTRRSICLGIGINEQNLLIQNRQRSGQIYRSRCLSDSSFLICNSDNFTHIVIFSSRRQCSRKQNEIPFLAPRYPFFTSFPSQRNIF